jgi:hypothetical protein
MSKYFWLFAPIVLGAIMYGALFFTMITQENRTIRYDCSIAEFAPDFPPQVREECRKKRSGRI